MVSFACLFSACLFLSLAGPLGDRLAASRTGRGAGAGATEAAATEAAATEATAPEATAHEVAAPEAMGTGNNDSGEMTLYPSGNFLKEMSLGHRHLVADLAWISSIQYYGKHRLSDQKYGLSPELFRVITDADPGFENAYLFASLVMNEGGFTDEAQRLLELGVSRNPDSWRLNFDLGFFHFVITRAWDKAAASFRAASKATGAPDYTRRFAAAAFEKADDPETARVLWQVIALESPNEEIRRIAEEKLAMND